MGGNCGLVELEEGWQILKMGFAKANKILEGCIDVKFTTTEYMNLYDCVFRMCTQGPFENTGVLYDRYKSFLEECVISTVLPSLEGKHEEILLQDLLKMWSNYKVMVRRLHCISCCIDRFHAKFYNVPSLNDISICCFCILVSPMLVDALNSLATERGQENVDVDLLRSVMSFIQEAEMVVPGYRQRFKGAIDYLTHGCNAKKVNSGSSSLSLRNDMAINQELASKYSNLTVGDGNSGWLHI